MPIFIDGTFSVAMPLFLDSKINGLTSELTRYSTLTQMNWLSRLLKNFRIGGGYSEKKGFAFSLFLWRPDKKGKIFLNQSYLALVSFHLNLNSGFHQINIRYSCLLNWLCKISD